MAGGGAAAGWAGLAGDLYWASPAALSRRQQDTTATTTLLLHDIATLLLSATASRTFITVIITLGQRMTWLTVVSLPMLGVQICSDQT